MAEELKAHAKLSASGSDRWMTCTPSARLEEPFPDQQTDFSEEGTYAHAVGEQELAKFLNRPPVIDPSITEEMVIKYDTQELRDYVQVYVDYSISKILEARSRNTDALILLEERLDFSKWVPEGFGTGDLVTVTDDLIDVVDLKFGKGVPVFADDNSQLRLYGLGALNKFGHLYDIKRVRMTICQPRLDSISSEELTVEELLAWAEAEVEPKAKLAWAGEGNFVAGDHCRFCKARFQCAARAAENLDMAKYDFKAPELLTPEQVGEILGKADALQKWAADVQGWALEQAERHGTEFPGWKLVEGRSNRKYIDIDAVADTLLAAGLDSAIIYERSLLGITAMEKAIGKVKFAELLNDLVVKPSGKPTLVQANDKRPAISSAASAAVDFS